MTGTIKLTQSRIDALKPPTTGEYTVHDAEVLGLSLRVRSSGSMVWSLRYRVGGRGGSLRRLTLGDARKVPLKAARDAARMASGERAKGTDPQAERKEAARRQRARLGSCVDSYIKDLERRGAASAGQIASLLRREMTSQLGETADLATLDRGHLAARIAAVAASGRPGASRELRTRMSVFLNWCVRTGVIEHNPLLGLKTPRATRSEETAVHGRSLNQSEIRAFWQAVEATDEPIYAGYLRTLLLTGCRRTELAQARWGWVQHDKVTGRAVLVLPREVTKNGRAHAVPLPAGLLAMMTALPRRATTDLIFPAWRGDDTAMTGWSKRWVRVTARLTELGVNGRLTLHDLRRSARSWWSELGVAEPIAELMLNHRPRSRLVALYDRSERMDERHRAAERWADFVFDLVEDKPPQKAVAAHDDPEQARDAGAWSTPGGVAAAAYLRGMRARA